MLALLAKVGKWFLKIPVLFAHFPGPALMLVLSVIIATGVSSSWVRGKFEQSARAELEIKLAQAEAKYAERRATAAEIRTDTINEANKVQRAIDRENQRAWFAALGSLAVSLGDKEALARLERAMEDMSNDPKFICRRESLPAPYLDSLYLPAWRPGDPE